MLKAISPIDGRYAEKTKELAAYFSEFALIKYRVWVEIKYLIALFDCGLPELPVSEKWKFNQLLEDWLTFSIEDATTIKEIERTTNHDVKAVEYYIKDKLSQFDLSNYKEFVHFALTSQDINNTAIPYTLKLATQKTMLPELNALINQIKSLAITWKDVVMLARTHGQPASPTTLGKEFYVFVERLNVQVEQLKVVPFNAKFGGATGNMNAHYVTYPEYDWHGFAKYFVEQYLGLKRSYPTTQIEHYDNLAALFHAFSRICTILIDFCRDVWTYISLDYFKQRIAINEVGSSAMPHKVNPIDFENAEGNLGLARAMFIHLADKLPISRLQRDLTDSTVLRNIGVPYGHLLIAIKSIKKGLDKILLNDTKINDDLDQNLVVVSEAIQNVLRRKGYETPYEQLKQLTRSNEQISQKEINKFIDSLSVDSETVELLKSITPYNYIGKN